MGFSKLLIKITFLKINYIFILINFVFDFTTTIIYGYLKGLMKYKFFSIYKSNYLFGLINIIIIIICYFSFGKKINNFINQTNDGNITIEFDAFNIVFSIITLIFSAFYGILTSQILNNYSIFHIFLPLYLLNLMHHISNTNQIKEKLVECVILIIIDIIEFIIMLVFLELIEINFCSLSLNTKKNIKERANKDALIFDSQNNNANDNDNDNDDSLINDEINDEQKSDVEDENENEKIELNEKK